MRYFNEDIFEVAKHFKPCPFCGSDEIVVERKSFFDELVSENDSALLSCNCLECHAEGKVLPTEIGEENYTNYKAFRDRLREKWNRRAS